MSIWESRVIDPISFLSFFLTECECDVDGSVDYKCDMKNGECFCIPGTLGDKCQCKISVIELKQD